jgi:hypothetical protein
MKKKSKRSRHGFQISETQRSFSIYLASLSAALHELDVKGRFPPKYVLLIIRDRSNRGDGLNNMLSKVLDKSCMFQVWVLGIHKSEAVDGSGEVVTSSSKWSREQTILKCCLHVVEIQHCCGGLPSLHDRGPKNWSRPRIVSRPERRAVKVFSFENRCK